MAVARLRDLPRTSVTLSRVAQGISSFAFAAAGTGGFVTSVLTHSVAAAILTLGAIAVGEGRLILGTLRLPRVWLVSVVGFLAMWLAAEAYHLAPVAPVSFLLLLVPLFTALMAPLFGERMTRNGVIGLAISLVGIALFATPTEGFGTEWAGLICALAAGGALALLWYFSRALSTDDSKIWALSASQTYPPVVIGLLVVLLLGAFPTGDALLWLLVAGAGYAGNVVLRLFGLRRMPASTASLIAPVSAIVSTVMGMVILDQIPDALTWVGAATITIGVIVATRDSPAGKARGTTTAGNAGGTTTAGNTGGTTPAAAAARPTDPAPGG
jgi:drug/metabolite transporter (DMT)-like permease